jgi:hypothetical protein
VAGVRRSADLPHVVALSTLEARDG